MRNRSKNILIINLLLFAAFVFIGFRSIELLRESRALKQESGVLEEEIMVLVQQKLELEAMLAELEMPEAVRREAKERFNLKNRGEKVVIVLPEEPREENELNGGWWEKTQKLFLKLLYD